jgi:hypothetical protein
VLVIFTAITKYTIPRHEIRNHFSNKKIKTLSAGIASSDVPLRDRALQLVNVDLRLEGDHRRRRRHRGLRDQQSLRLIYVFLQYRFFFWGGVDEQGIFVINRQIKT